VVVVAVVLVMVVGGGGGGCQGDGQGVGVGARRITHDTLCERETIRMTAGPRTRPARGSSRKGCRRRRGWWRRS